MLASRAAPPSSAPMAMAPVWTGAPPVLCVVVVVVVVVELLVLLSSEAISDEMEDLSDPVAVLYTDDSDDSSLLRSEAEMDDRSEL